MDSIAKHGITSLVGLSVAFTSEQLGNRIKFTVLFLKKIGENYFIWTILM